MIQIDGSFGEGGGQILRTSLALSLLTGKPFCIQRIRAGRSKPGLMRQHLTAVNAAAEIGNADIQGNRIGSDSFTFIPETIRAGNYHFAIGSAGSCTLVLQTVLPALIRAEGPSEIILEGGTHNPFAPPFDFLAKAFLPLLNRMGPTVTTVLHRPGFYPAGGGRFQVSVRPVKALQGMELVTRGTVIRKSATAMVSNLPLSIAQRELKIVKETLDWHPDQLQALEVKDSKGPGNLLSIEVESAALTEVFTGFGERGVSAEKVAGRTARSVREYLAQAAPVGRYLADQLLIPMAMAGRGRFRTLSPSLHTTTNIEIIKQFLDVAIRLQPIDAHQWEIEISG